MGKFLASGMELVYLTVVVVLSAAMITFMWLGRVRLPATPAVPEVVKEAPYACAGCGDVADITKKLQAEVRTLTAAVAAGIEHVDRVENRIRGTIKRARKELEEHGIEAPGLDAEVATLPLEHGGGSEKSPVQLVPPGVAEPGSSIPGVSPEQLRRVRGI